MENNSSNGRFESTKHIMNEGGEWVLLLCYVVQEKESDKTL